MTGFIQERVNGDASGKWEKWRKYCVGYIKRLFASAKQGAVAYCFSHKSVIMFPNLTYYISKWSELEDGWSGHTT